MRRFALLAVLALTSLTPCLASADPADPADSRGVYVHLLGTAELGRSLRFNNPFRLASPIGSTSESVSLAATYSDLGIGALFGKPTGLQHGAYFHWSTALSGIPQDVFSLSYIALYRPEARWSAYARAGLPYIANPNPNVGFELALGGLYHVTSGLGATAELSGSGFYGAATRDVSATFIPLLSLQIGLSIDLEILP